MTREVLIEFIAPISTGNFTSTVVIYVNCIIKWLFKYIQFKT